MAGRPVGPHAAARDVPGPGRRHAGEHGRRRERAGGAVDDRQRGALGSPQVEATGGVQDAGIAQPGRGRALSYGTAGIEVDQEQTRRPGLAREQGQEAGQGARERVGRVPVQGRGHERRLAEVEAPALGQGVRVDGHQHGRAIRGHHDEHIVVAVPAADAGQRGRGDRVGRMDSAQRTAGQGQHGHGAVLHAVHAVSERARGRQRRALRMIGRGLARGAIQDVQAAGLMHEQMTLAQPHRARRVGAGQGTAPQRSALLEIDGNHVDSACGRGHELERA